METPKKGATAGTSTPSTPRKLENMSQEDLVKNCKKQMILLQKLKVKCDDLQGKLKQQSDYDQIKQKAVKSDDTVSNMSKQIAEIMESESKLKSTNNSLMEELDCVKLKQDTLVSSLQCLQKEFQEVSDERSKLAKASESASHKQLEVEKKLDEMKRERQDLLDQIGDESQQLLALKDHIKKLNATDLKLKELNKTLQIENKEVKNELAALKITVDMFKSQQQASGGKSNEKIADLNESIKTITAQFTQLKNDHQNMKTEFEKLAEEKEIQQLEFATAKEKYFALQDDLDSLREKKEKMDEDMNLSVGKLKQMENENIKLIDEHQKEIDQLKQNISKSLKRQEGLTSSCQDLKVSLSEAIALKEKAEAKCKETNVLVETLKAQLCDTQSQKESDAHEGKESLLKQLEKRNEELDRLTEAFNELGSEKETLADSVETAVLEKETLLKEHSREREQWDNLKLANLATIKDLKNAVESKSSALEHLQTEQNDAKASFEAIKVELEEMKVKHRDQLKSIEMLEDTKKMNHKLRDNLAQNEVKCQELAGECDTFKSKLLDSEKLEVGYKEKVSSLESACLTKQEECDAFVQEKQLLLEEEGQKREKMESLESEVIALQNRLASSELSNEKLQEEISNFQNTLSDDADLLNKLNVQSKENSDLTQSICKLETSLHKTDAKYTELKGQCSEDKNRFDAKVEEMKKENDELKGQYETSMMQCKDLQEEMDQVRTEMSQKLLSAEEEISRLSNDVGEELKKIKEEKSSLQSELEVHVKERAEAADLKQKLQQTEKHHTEIQKINSKLESDVHSISLRLTEITAKYENASEKLQLVEDEKSSIIVRVEEASSSLQVKEEQLMKVDADLQTLQAEHDLKVKELTKQIEETDKERFILQDQITNLHEELNKAKLLHENLQKSDEDTKMAAMEEYKNKLEHSESDALNLKKLLAEKDNLCTSLKAECSSLKDRVDVLEDTTKTKENDVISNVAEIDKLNNLLRDATKDHSEDQEKFKNLSIQIEDLKNEIEQLKENCKKSDKEVQEKSDLLEKMKSSTDNDRANLLQAQDEVQQKLQAENQTLMTDCEDLKIQLETLRVSKDESTAINHSEQRREIETLQQNIKEKESYSSKLKMIVVKAKKELDTVKQQLQAYQEENTQLNSKLSNMGSKLMGSQAQASNVQMMQLECDKLQDQVDHIKMEKQDLHKILEESQHQTSLMLSQKEDLQRKVTSLNADLEKSRKSKVDTEKLLTSSKAAIGALEKEKEGILKDKNVVKQELEVAKIQIQSLTKKHEDVERELSASQISLLEATKNIKQNDVMSLEMARYEETICDLQSHVSDLEGTAQESEVKIQELEEKIIELQEDRKSTEQLRVEAEERVTRTKQSLDETRDELTRLTDAELEVRVQMDDTRRQYEALQQQNEQYKLDIAAKASEARMLEEKIITLQNSSLRNTELFERKTKNLQVEVDSLRNEKETLASDYENYKVRAHSVLKQQKTKESKQQVERDDTELIQLRQQSDQLQLKLIETQNILSSRDNELDLLQGDYDRLLRQQQQSSESALERETRWKSRVKTLQQELTSLRKKHADVTMQLTQQNDLTTASVSKEVALLKTEHEKEMESLQEEIANKDQEIRKLGNELKAKAEEKQTVQLPKQRPPVHASLSFPRLHSLEHHVDYRSMAREAGEGEENPDQESVVSFEQLLQSQQIKSVTELSESASVTSEVQLKQLELKYIAQSKQLDHTTEVARENESTASRLSDQNRVLKEEIRRLEKNQEREKSVSNMEYLKNVVYKFVTLPPCDERVHLVPVIDMMLKLNSDEKKTLQTLALGDDAPSESPSGWGNYLQRWSGMQ